MNEGSLGCLKWQEAGGTLGILLDVLFCLAVFFVALVMILIGGLIVAVDFVLAPVRAVLGHVASRAPLLF